MAYSATQEILRREAELQKARSQQIADRALGDLARQYGLSQEQLNANLEGRGVYRSGEAATARTRLASENQARRSDIFSDLQYGQQMTDIDLMKQLASLQARSLGSGNNNPGGVAFDDPNIPNDRTKVPYTGYNPYQPYTAPNLPRTPVGTSTSRLSFASR